MASPAFLVFKIFPGRTPVPPPPPTPFLITKYAIYRKYVIYFVNWTLLKTQALLVIFYGYVIDGLYIYWLNGLLHPFYTFIYHNMDLKDQDTIKSTRKFDVNLLFIFVRISVKQPLFCLK